MATKTKGGSRKAQATVESVDLKALVFQVVRDNGPINAADLIKRTGASQTDLKDVVVAHINDGTMVMPNGQLNLTKTVRAANPAEPGPEAPVVEKPKAKAAPTSANVTATKPKAKLEVAPTGVVAKAAKALEDTKKVRPIMVEAPEPEARVIADVSGVRPRRAPEAEPVVKVKDASKVAATRARPTSRGGIKAKAERAKAECGDTPESVQETQGVLGWEAAAEQQALPAETSVKLSLGHTPIKVPALLESKIAADQMTLEQLRERIIEGIELMHEHHEEGEVLALELVDRSVRRLAKRYNRMLGAE